MMWSYCVRHFISKFQMSIDNDKFQFVGEFYLKEYATVRRGFFFVFSRSVFGFRKFGSVHWNDGAISYFRFALLLKRCGSSNLSEQKKHLFRIHLGFDKRSSVVVQICPKCRCIYGFVNKFWTGRIFERLWNVCGGSNLSTVLLLWGIYIKKCISLVRICLQTRNARNASTKFRKTSEPKF